MRRFWPRLRPFLRPAAIVLAASLVTPAIETAAVWLFKTLVDGVLEVRIRKPAETQPNTRRIPVK